MHELGPEHHTSERAFIRFTGTALSVTVLLAEPGAPAGDLACAGFFNVEGSLVPFPSFDAAQTPEPTATMSTTMPMNHRRFRCR
jgi:hypothetical protein